MTLKRLVAPYTTIVLYEFVDARLRARESHVGEGLERARRWLVFQDANGYAKSLARRPTPSKMYHTLVVN